MALPARLAVTLAAASFDLISHFHRKRSCASDRTRRRENKTSTPWCQSHGMACLFDSHSTPVISFRHFAVACAENPSYHAETRETGLTIRVCMIPMCSERTAMLAVVVLLRVHCLRTSLLVAQVIFDLCRMVEYIYPR
jgi:hypothetical protein